MNSNIDGIIIKEKGDHDIQDCLNCGICSKNCPMNLNPKYVYDHGGKVKSEYKEDCLQCGLCSFLCPSHRDLKGSMRGEDNNV